MSQSGGLQLIGLIPGCGYGDSACEYAAGMDSLGHCVSWMPVRDDSAELFPKARAIRDVQGPIHQQMSRLWNRDIEAQAFLLDVPPHRWHWHWLEAEPKLRPYCYLTWEVDELPREWLGPLNHYETVFVPSAFNKQTFEAGGVTTKIELIPHVARQSGAGNGRLNLGAVNDDDFVFYTIGAWTSRKAMEQTIRAYLDAFSSKDPVALVIKTEDYNQIALQQLSIRQRAETVSQSLSTAWALASILAAYANPARIHLIAGRVSPATIDQLHLRGDCFISLTHGEGWGLGSFDAALAGNPVIMTGWGGQLDYLGKDYPYLVEYSLKSTDQYPDDGFTLHSANAHWAEADQNHAISLLRSVWQDTSASAKAKTLQTELQTRFAARRVCGKLAGSMGLKQVAE